MRLNKSGTSYYSAIGLLSIILSIVLASSISNVIYNRPQLVNAQTIKLFLYPQGGR